MMVSNSKKVQAMYYILAEREADTRKWILNFGDYERAVVKQERLDYADSADCLLRDLKVVAVNGDTQADVDAAIAALN